MSRTRRQFLATAGSFALTAVGGGLAAAAYLIRHAGISGQEITVYEAGGQLGGAFLLAGSAATGYILPSGALFDSEFRCTNDLLAA